MTTCTATECEVECAPGMYLCRACVKELSGLIGQAETLLDLAGHAIMKLGCNRSAGGSSSAVSSAPLNLDAVHWRDALAKLMEVNGLDDTRRDPDRRAWDAAKSGNAGYVVADLDYKVGRLARIIDLPVERRRLGKCTVEHCPGYWWFSKGQIEGTCDTCKSTMSVVDWVKYRIEHDAPDHPARLHKVYTALGALGVTIVNYNTMKSWARRQVIEPVGQDTHGHDLYTMNQILDRIGPVVPA